MTEPNLHRIGIMKRREGQYFTTITDISTGTKATVGAPTLEAARAAGNGEAKIALKKKFYQLGLRFDLFPWRLQSNYHWLDAESRCLYHIDRAVRWMTPRPGEPNSNSFRHYVTSCALDRISAAFSQCNRIKDAELRAYYRASITRMRNWLTHELCKLERSAHV